MLRSIAERALSALVAVAIVSPFILITGCADLVTYSHKANEEGMRRYREGAYGDAAGAFRQATRQEPRDYHSHYYLGECYDKLQEHQQAFVEYHTALDVMDQSVEGRFDDAFRQQVLDGYSRAVAKYDQQEVELNTIEQRAKQSQKGQDWFLLAKIYRLRGDADLALDAYRRACHFDSQDFYVRKEAGLFLLDPLNNTKDATYYLLQAHRLNGDDEAVNNALARLGITPEPSDKPSADAPAATARSSGSSAPKTAQLPRD